jgi:transcriptional regulator with XRE-family HTH domain
VPGSGEPPIGPQNPKQLQQAHKYERGINRVSAGRLFEIARVLGVPVGHFFEGIGEEGVRPVNPHQRMLLEIARNFADIPNERHQEALSADK